MTAHKSTRRIALVVTSHDKKGSTGQATGAYLPELVHPYWAFVQAGYEVDFVSPKGGTVPLDGVTRTDPGCAKFLDDAAALARLHASKASRGCEAAHYDGIFFAGGHGTMWDFPTDEALAELTAKVYETGGVVAAVCHGPAALVNVRLSDGSYLVQGKQVSAFTNDEERAVKLDTVVPFLLADKLEERGAKHQAAPNWQRKVVVDGRLVTGQNPASAEETARAMLHVLRELFPATPATA